MKRILSIDNLSIDLGNIKLIKKEPYSGSANGCYVIIDLLKGKEYVYNEDTNCMKLIKPRIIKGFGSVENANFFIKTIEDAWENYLIENEI